MPDNRAFGRPLVPVQMVDRGAVEFSAHRDKFPPEIAEYFYSIWDKREVWRLALPHITLPVRKLEWQLDFPFWSSQPPKPLFDLKPRVVLDHLDAYPGHRERIRAAGLEFPLDVALFGDRCVILDGLHRLLKAILSSTAAIECRLASRAHFRVSANLCRDHDRSINADLPP
jgi:hypothetical protein